MPVTLPPDPQPSTSLGRDEFIDAMDEFVAWMYIMVPEFRAAILALDANDVRGTSTTSFTPNAGGLGSKAFVTQSGKSWLPGMWVTIGYTSDGREYAAGVVESYSGSTLNVDVKVVSNHATPRTSWQIAMSPPITDLVVDEEIVVHTGNGYGSTNTKRRRYSTVFKDTLNGRVTYADSETLGASFTVNADGLYYIERKDTSAVSSAMGVALNPSSGTTNYPSGLSFNQKLGADGGVVGRVITTRWFTAGDIIAPHDGGTLFTGTSDDSYMIFRRLK